MPAYVIIDLSDDAHPSHVTDEKHLASVLRRLPNPQRSRVMEIRREHRVRASYTIEPATASTVQSGAQVALERRRRHRADAPTDPMGNQIPVIDE